MGHGQVPNPIHPLIAFFATPAAFEVARVFFLVVLVLIVMINLIFINVVVRAFTVNMVLDDQQRHIDHSSLGKYATVLIAARSRNMSRYAFMMTEPLIEHLSTTIGAQLVCVDQH